MLYRLIGYSKTLSHPICVVDITKAYPIEKLQTELDKDTTMIMGTDNNYYYIQPASYDCIKIIKVTPKE